MSDHTQILFEHGQRLAPRGGRLADGDWSIEWRTLEGGKSAGVELVTLSNGTFRICVIPTRGMGVLNAQCGDVEIGWSSPVSAPVHPQFVNLKSRNALGWLDGFNELLCRCGLSSNGPPGIDEGARSPIESDLTLHGRIANTPAHRVEVGFDPERDRLWICGECREETLFGPQLSLRSVLTVPLDGLHFEVEDTIANQASTPAELEMLYHINIGPPFLEAGSKLVTPFREVSPRDPRAAEDVDSFAEYLGPTSGYAEQVYFFDPLADEAGLSTALLHNKAANLGVSVHFNREQLPCFAQWKCTQPEADGYVAGLEPGTNYPNFKSFERTRGRVRSLDPGATYTTRLTLNVHPSAQAVSAVMDEIAAVQGDVVPVIHPHPTEPFAVA